MNTPPANEPLTDTIDPEDLHPESQAHEVAFMDAKSVFSLFGEDLRPFSPSRKVAAQKMGMMYPYVGDGGGAQFEKTGSYPGMLMDVIILCWLCSLADPDELDKEERKAGVWTPVRALSRSEAALEAALAWGTEKELIDLNGAPYREAMQVFMAIVTGVAASEFKLVMTGGDDAEAAPETTAGNV